jgi:hypothetical protein
LLDRQLGAVETLRKFQDGRITSQMDIVQNGAGAAFYLGIEQAGSGRDFGELGGKIFVRVADGSHRDKIEKIQEQVKIPAKPSLLIQRF